MTTSNELIDFEFGLRQLSGNKTLLYRLLKKFADEYRNIDTRLNQLINGQDFSEAEILVHTLKGVAGNLGCNEVFAASRTVNQQLKTAMLVQRDVDFLISQMLATAKVIDELQDDSAPTSNSTSTRPQAQNSLQLLSQALKNHEFISHEKLSGWLDDLSVTDAQRNQISTAVDELDYEDALALLSELK